MRTTFKAPITKSGIEREIDINSDGAVAVDIVVERYVDGVSEDSARFSCDPATADAIASALHVAAAQVRRARGEKVEWKHVEGEQRWAGDMACVMGPTFDETGDDFVLIARADVPRLITELGAWLAAHPEVAK